MKASNLNFLLSTVIFGLLLVLGYYSWSYMCANFTHQKYVPIVESQYEQTYQFTASDGQIINSSTRLAWDMDNKRIVLYDFRYNRYSELSNEYCEELLHQYPLPSVSLGRSILEFLFGKFRILSLIVLFLIELIILSFPLAFVDACYIKLCGTLEDCKWYLDARSIMLYLPVDLNVGKNMVEERKDKIRKYELDKLINHANQSIKDPDFRKLLTMPLLWQRNSDVSVRYPIHVVYDNRIIDQKEFYKKKIAEYQAKLASDPRLEEKILSLRALLEDTHEYYAIPKSPFELSKLSRKVVESLEKAFGRLLGSEVYDLERRLVMAVDSSVPGIYLYLVLENADDGSYYSHKDDFRFLHKFRMGFILSIVDNGKKVDLMGKWLPLGGHIDYTFAEGNFDLIDFYDAYVNKYMNDLENAIAQ